MGSLSLVCPMCCGETFDNSQSLKYHLLSMTDNLYCPNCAERSDSVAALIQHLDSCGEISEAVNIQSVIDYKSMAMETQINRTQCGFLATVSKDGGITVVGDLCGAVENKEDGIEVVEKMDVKEDSRNVEGMVEEEIDKTEDGDSDRKNENEKRIKTENNTSEMTEKDEMELLKPEGSLENLSPMGIESFEVHAEEEPEETELVQVKEEMREVESDALYSCSSCGVSFNSVLTHIKDYHDGQEVVLEMAEQQMEDLPEEAEKLEGEEMEEEAKSPGTRRSCSMEENINFGSSVGSERTTSGFPRQRQTMNTLRTEECVDSEGRLYTRKVVQIERFWDRGPGAATGAQSQLQQQQHQQFSKNAPMIEKFFSNAEGLKIGTKNSRMTSVANTTMTVATTTSTPTTSSSHTGIPLRMYRCNKCLEQFAKLADFRIHACIHGNNQCDLCEQAFASVKALQLHARIHEAEAEGVNDSNFVCLTCGTEFSSHKSLRLHSRMHAPVRARHVDAPEGTATENFTCSECGKTLSESYRKAHMALHKGDSVTCSVCNRKFDSADSLAMHAAVHVELLQTQQKQIQGKSLEDQNMEEESNISGDKFAKGTKGGRVTDKDGGIIDNSEKPYQCQHCGRRFTRPHEKVKHERIHTGEKPHGCEVCGKTFRVSYCLTLHMRTHTGVRPYACQHCGKRFKASSVYNHHLLTHGEERAYTCPYCPKTFKTRVQLAGHKNSHTKPFRCTECSRPFASLYAARAHIQTHKKDNNLKFSCYICGASYGRAFALKDHLKQHTGQEILVPPPEPAREEEVTDTDDFIITEETEEYEEIEEIAEIEEEDHKLVEAAAAAAAHVDDDHSEFIGVDEPTDE